MQSLHRTLPTSRPVRKIQIPGWITVYASALVKAGAQAVGLFGSRASGHYLEDSDWDIVAIGTNPNEDVYSTLPKATRQSEEINTIWVAPAKFGAERNEVGTISFEIDQNCCWLLGSLDSVTQKNVRKAPSRERILKFAQHTYWAFFDALQHLKADWRNKGRPNREFQTNAAIDTATAAKFAAKLTCVCHGLTIMHTLNVAALADKVSDEWKADVMNLNSDTKRLHTLPYEIGETEPFHDSVARLRNTLNLLERLYDSSDGFNFSSEEMHELEQWIQNSFYDIDKSADTHPSLIAFRAALFTHIRERFGVVLEEP